MKYKTTRKAIVNGSVNVKCAGYCDLQNLLRNHSAVENLLKEFCLKNGGRAYA